jgi:hypothetical protein
VRGLKLLQGSGDTGAHRVTLRGGGDSKQGAGGDSADSESRPPAVGSGSSEVPVGNLGRRRSHLLSAGGGCPQWGARWWVSKGELWWPARTRGHRAALGASELHGLEAQPVGVEVTPHPTRDAG